ncbi:MAG: hypothetical protein MJ066_03845 [Clostridia bacterium]|nr:hypothetical protein [Clostridia bacterium]
MKNLKTDRQKIAEYFIKNEYGLIPENPISVNGKTVDINKRFCASKATLENIELTIKTKKGNVKFPFKFCYLNGKKNIRTVIVLNFRSDVPDIYIPAEEIVDRKYNFVSINYQDIVLDNKEEPNANEKVLRKLSPSSGKIAMWAWGAMRVLDYLYSRKEVNKNKVGIAGHSRLGKTAILAGAFDERFKFVHSNCSGTGGAGLYKMKNKESEKISDLLFRFSYWFTPDFKKLKDKEKYVEYDQDALMSLISPRLLNVSSAKEDLWANPKSEKKALYNCKKIWDNPENTNYQVRKGTHYFSRDDWHGLLDFLDKKL